MKMIRLKAISLSMPWAHLVADDLKPLETRTWTTKHRGPLVICAAKTPDLTARPLGGEIIERAASLWRREDLGHALAIARLVDCRLMTTADELRACFGVTPGRRVFELEDIQKFSAPFPVKGMLGIFEVDIPLALLPPSYQSL